ncbi:MAG TPA: peptidase M14 [Gammaproteobacteria bacterium]|nr:peptidase M14 [Gammaproteobacteria bacterium]
MLEKNGAVLRELEQLPEGLLACSASELYDVLGGPTLIHLPGRQAQPLFVSVLLHGNEDVGWEAVRRLLSSYHDRELPRALSLFIGNVRAAAQGCRHLADQPDFNRIWKCDGNTAEYRMARQVLDSMERRGPFASIDIHNNTGFNPHYACINCLDDDFRQLALLFSRTVVFFQKPDTVLSLAFARLCPSTTIECGKPGESHGVQHALECIDAALHLTHFPQHGVADQDIDLYHTVAVVKIPSHISIGFRAEDEDADICFIDELDRLNFHELPAGTLLGWTQGEDNPGIHVWDEAGVDVGARYLDFRNGEIRTRAPLMPSMLTLDRKIIHQDCLCYIMERMPATLANELVHGDAGC